MKWVLAMAILFFCCCRKERVIVIPLGNYTGTFNRTTSDTVSRVSFTVSLKKFDGGSTILYYPSICAGTYTVEGDSVNFVNECDYSQSPAEKTLILNGKYGFRLSNDSLFISKLYPEFSGAADIYSLKKSL